MRLFILGATGHTGKQLIDLTLARSHSVTAFVRSPEKIARQHPLLTVVRGNPRNADEMTRALQGHDAVLSALGVRPPKAFRPHSLVQECAASTVAAMTRAGVMRLVLVSAAVLFPGSGLQFEFFRAILKYIARDLGTAEEIVRATPLEWTIARPPRLTNGTEEGYRSALNSLPNGGAAMSFRAVAAFMVDTAEHHSFIREIVGLGTGRVLTNNLGHK